MVMSSKKIGRRAMEATQTGIDDILKSAPAMLQSDGKAEAALKAAVAPKKAQSFSEAFKAARADKGAGKTFTWGGKSYSTNMAGEGAKKPTRSGTGSSTPKAAAPTTNTRAATELSRTAARSQKNIRENRAENQADFRKRMQEKRGYAKGGSIDGCAIRGKTRAPMKKGK